MSSGVSNKTKAILDALWQQAYGQLWNQPIGSTTVVTATHGHMGAPLVYRLYAAVRPIGRFDEATDTHPIDDCDPLSLSYAARLGRCGIVRCGFTVGTS